MADSSTSGERPGKGARTDRTSPSWWFVLRSTIRESLEDAITDSAAGLTFFAVLSIFPAAIALVSIFTLVGQDPTVLRDLLEELDVVVPDDQLEMILGILDTLLRPQYASTGIVAGLLAALWTASRYVKAFGRAMNTIYGVPEGRPLVRYHLQMYAVTAALLLLVAFSVIFVVLSGPVAETVGRLLGIEASVLSVWRAVQWPLLILLVVVVVALLYRSTPNVRPRRMRWISVGALVAIAGGALASAAFGVYLAYADLGATYGTLTGVIVGLLWMWLMNIALLFGAELDAELERRRQLRHGIAAEEGLQLPLRDTRASDKRVAQYQRDVALGRSIRENVVDARRDDAGDPSPRFRRYPPDEDHGRRYGSSAVGPDEMRGRGT